MKLRPRLEFTDDWKIDLYRFKGPFIPRSWNWQVNVGFWVLQLQFLFNLPGLQFSHWQLEDAHNSIGLLRPQHK